MSTPVFDPSQHVLAVRVHFDTPLPDSGFQGVQQVAGLPEMTTHEQVLDFNAGVFDFLSYSEHNLHTRERIERNQGRFEFGFLPYPPPHNGLGDFMPSAEHVLA